MKKSIKIAVSAIAVIIVTIIIIGGIVFSVNSNDEGSNEPSIVQSKEGHEDIFSEPKHGDNDVSFMGFSWEGYSILSDGTFIVKDMNAYVYAQFYHFENDNTAAGNAIGFNGGFYASTDDLVNQNYFEISGNEIQNIGGSYTSDDHKGTDVEFNIGDLPVQGESVTIDIYADCNDFQGDGFTESNENTTSGEWSEGDFQYRFIINNNNGEFGLTMTETPFSLLL